MPVWDLSHDSRFVIYVWNPKVLSHTFTRMHVNVVILAPLCEGYKLKMFSLAWWKGIEWRRTQSSVEPMEDMKIQRGHCVFKWILHGHLESTPSATIWIMFEVISTIFLVVLKYHRRPWVNIFDTDISRCINTYIRVVYLAFFGIFMLLQMSVSKILAQGRLWYFKTTKIL